MNSQPAGTLDAARDGYSIPAEVARYRTRARNGLLAWETEVARRHFASPGKLLDIGCGGGREALALSALGHQVVGVDISPEQVASARATAVALGRKITFDVCDGSRLAFSDATFDYVLVWAQVLGNVPGRQTRVGLLAECARVLKPSGVLSFSVHNRAACEPMARERGLIVSEGPEEGDFVEREEGVTRYWHYFGREEIVGLCEEAGLTVKECCLAAELGQTGWETVWVVVCGRA